MNISKNRMQLKPPVEASVILEHCAQTSCRAGNRQSSCGSCRLLRLSIAESVSSVIMTTDFVQGAAGRASWLQLMNFAAGESQRSKSVTTIDIIQVVISVLISVFFIGIVLTLFVYGICFLAVEALRRFCEWAEEMW